MANPALTAGEMAHIIGLTRPALIVTQPTSSAVKVIKDALSILSDAELDRRFYTQGRLFSVDLDSGDYGLDTNPTISLEKRVSGMLVRDWKWLLDYSGPAFEIEPMRGDENARRAAFILWSSGTSGKSKG
jgi:4-coumarate--CoA ligase